MNVSYKIWLGQTGQNRILLKIIRLQQPLFSITGKVIRNRKASCLTAYLKFFLEDRVGAW